MADIPLQRLNVDERGFAGPMLGSLGSPGRVKGYGIPPEFMRILAEQQALRRRQAQMQLALMKEDLQASRQARRESQRRPQQSLLERRMMDQPLEHQGRYMGMGPQELGAAAASTLDPGNRLGRTASDFLKLGQYMQFLGPQEVGAGTRTAGAGFADLARQASANAVPLASMQGPDRGRYSFLRGSPGSMGRGFAKGTLPGTVPKTGNYQLHKDEIVVSAPQVAPGGKLDTGLMSYLIEDKMRKGITKENPKGAKGYQRGSISYAGLGGAFPSMEDIIRLQREQEMEPEPPPRTYRTPSFGEGLGMALGSGFGAVGEGASKIADWLGSFAGDVERGYSGAGPSGDRLQKALEAAQVQPTPEDMGGPSLAPMQLGLPEEEQAQRDLEVSLSRVRGGDLGSRESPLTLSGSSGLGANSAGITAPPGGRGDENLPPAERYFAPESPEWRQAQSQKIMATTNRAKADRIRDHLLREGMNMDPDTRKDLMKGAEWLDSMADMVEERQEIIKAKREERAAASDEALLEFEKERQKARAKGEEMMQSTRDKNLEAIRKHYDELEKMYVDPKNEEGREDILRAMVRSYLAQAQAQGIDTTQPEAEIAVLASMGKFDDIRDRLQAAGASPEEIEEAIAEMGG